MVRRDSALEIMGLIDYAKQVQKQFQKYTVPVATKNIIYHFLTRERKTSYGTAHPNETIYIIRSIADRSPFYIGPVHNLLANYFYVLSHIQYARSKGWIPVVDQLNYPVYNSQSTPIHGTKNPWEYFWLQPGGLTLEEAYQCKNVVLSKQSWFWEWDMGYNSAKYMNKEIIGFYHSLLETTPLNAVTKKLVESAQQMTLSLKPQKKILGVNVRIGGHAVRSAIHGNGHPIQPEIEDLIAIVKSKMIEWKMDYIFLASDTDFAVNKFKKEFQDVLIVYPRIRTEIGKEFSRDFLKQLYAPGMEYQTALNYLIEMELLSMCSALIGSITSGLRYAIIENNNQYEHVDILENGYFDDKNKRFNKYIKTR